MGGYVRQRRLLRDLFALRVRAKSLWHGTDLTCLNVVAANITPLVVSKEGEFASDSRQCREFRKSGQSCNGDNQHHGTGMIGHREIFFQAAGLVFRVGSHARVEYDGR